MDLRRQFAPVAHALRDGIIEHYRARGEDLATPAGMRTLETNSTLASERAEMLLRQLADRDGRADLTGRRLVDLGCGFGSLSLAFALAGAEVVGIDPNPDRPRVAERVGRHFGLAATFRRGWLEDLTLDGERFDVAVLNNVLCYLVPRDARRRALGDTCRLLVPGGALLARDPSRTAPTDPFTGLPLVHQLPPRVATFVVRRRRPPRSPVRLRSPGGLRRELRRAGFVQVKRARLDQPRWRPARYHHTTAQRAKTVESRPVDDVANAVPT